MRLRGRDLGRREHGRGRNETYKEEGEEGCREEMRRTVARTESFPSTSRE
jgi:hypothetical protein